MRKAPNDSWKSLEEDFEKRMKIKDPGKKGVYSFCFHFEGSKVWDERVVYQKEKLDEYEKLMDYCAYLDSWDLLKKALE